MRVSPGSTETFLRDHLVYEGLDCIEWPFYTYDNGYGQAVVNGQQQRAHRAMCILAHGEPPTARHEAAHSCGNRKCINKRHIRWATSSENKADKAEHGTSNRGGRHWKARLSDDDVRAIRADGRTQRAIAADYGISQGNISSIRLRRAWGHVE